MLKNEMKIKEEESFKGSCSEYNIFIEKQIKAGMTFSQAAKHGLSIKLLKKRIKENKLLIINLLVLKCVLEKLGQKRLPFGS